LSTLTPARLVECRDQRLAINASRHESAVANVPINRALQRSGQKAKATAISG